MIIVPALSFPVVPVGVCLVDPGPVVPVGVCLVDPGPVVPVDGALVDPVVPPVAQAYWDCN